MNSPKRQVQPETPSDRARYSAEIIAEESEFPALDYAGPRIAGPGNYFLIHPAVDPSGSPVPGGTPVLELVVEAETDVAARRKVVDVYRKMRAESNLPSRDPEILLIYSTNQVEPPIHFFIEEADELFDQQRFEWAIVAAQVACEICIRNQIETFADTDGNDLAKLSLAGAGFSLMNRNSLKVFEAVFGFPPTKADCWNDYKLHVQRRNAVLHRGLRASRDDAAASINAMYAFRAFVERCVPLTRFDAKPDESHS